MNHAAPEPAEHDDKDWTWVLDRRCDQCGFVASDVQRDDIGTLTRGTIARFSDVLAGDPSVVRARPRPDKWSPLEYAAHVRDVYRINLQRLRWMLTEESPMFPNWDQGPSAIEGRYDLLDPGELAAQLRHDGEAIAAAFDSVDGAEWNRTAMRSDGAEFTVESFARYFLHDPIHHIWDVSAG